MMPTTPIAPHYDTGEITRLCDQSILDTRAKLDALTKLPKNKRSFKAVTEALDQVLTDFHDQVSPLTFMGYVSTEPKIAQEASACESKTSQFAVEIFTRKDLYLTLKSARGKTKTQKRLHHEFLRSFEKNGLRLSDESLAEFKSLKLKLAELETEFAKNLNLDASFLEFSGEELKGVPESLIQRFKKTADGKKYIVTTKSTDVTPVMENAQSSATRKKMYAAYNNRQAKENLPLFEEALVIRQKLAHLMGFKTWADYNSSDRMAKNAAHILKFLNNLKSKLSASCQKDLKDLLELKKTLEPGTQALHPWDIGYLSEQLRKKNYQLDEEVIRQYFPAETVIQGMFEIYSKLLGVRYVEVKDAQTWSPDVKLYEIQDLKTRKKIAHFYADFFPRKGKYGHAAAFYLISGRKTAKGYSIPTASIVANFSPPSTGKPSLLTHDEVETIFHEFGHIMHQTLTRAPYGSLSGSNVAQDFVEAPSQMLENWVWQPKTLRMMSGHYQDPSKKIPQDLLDRMIAARDLNKAYYYMRQIYFGLLDMEYHTRKGAIDSTAVLKKLYRDLFKIEPLEEDHFQASFGHLMGGYDAGYYGYLWSKVYAEDMFTRFENGKLLDPKVGAAYRKFILEPGSMEEPSRLLKRFLKRSPNPKAFLKRLKT